MNVCKKCCSSDVYYLKWVDANNGYCPDYIAPVDTDYEEWCGFCRTYTEIIKEDEFLHED